MQRTTSSSPILLALLEQYTFFFFNDTATTEIYTLSLHDALPISQIYARFDKNDWRIQPAEFYRFHDAEVNTLQVRSEERFSRNAETDLVCRLLLEKKTSDRRCCLVLWMPTLPSHTLTPPSHDPAL